VHAIARLELVRTLRDLGAGLDEIRQVLAAKTTLRELATTHLRLVEDQLRQFRARRAVLRTIVRQHTTTEQVSLTHKLVSMSDDDRDQLITPPRFVPAQAHILGRALGLGPPLHAVSAEAT
jgi:DNA-binding transcriptional MerR regulator